MFRVHEQVMQAHREAVEQEENEGETPHCVTEQPSTGRPGGHGVEGEIGREQPEIDDRMQRP